ncbi:putative ATPase of the CDC48/PAS1/SEC18 family [Suhomyces tanzawaensis NRRL Y-17324]|uniref:Putative ATPase of the CDC48/PAS1/SEC18 family n=1 Tax=Suhomyces tanzawaensis NRRL Y-17324 TaxID=984487 RepID=A0A1E4SL83_9ASCO|nr:putative ATPase of the CDC48/PAS1/SEC18 family [Suhomyces tanzawaensis NRRL Y-17324]ODV80285.1 putative ATPase of the CDC48/PAS1/SEC18 family [Suhomyces tanzawaensis NRRL Y-17324]
MSSKGTLKKKSSTPSGSATGEVPAKKIKMPKSFIVRPSVGSSHKSMMKIQVNPEVVQGLDLKDGQFVFVSKADSGLPGVLALVSSSNDLNDHHVINMSSGLRSLGGFLLGDRVQLTKHLGQPDYAKDLSVYLEDSQELTEAKSNAIKKALDNIGIVYPGLKVTITSEESFVIHIIDVNEESFVQSFEKLNIGDIDSDVVQINTVSPAYIFHPTKTVIQESKETAPAHEKYPQLPQLLNYGHIGGLSKQIATLQSTIELPLHNPTLFSNFGISPPRGILLHGPPGTGKTMLLRCVANQTNAHILTINGPSIVSKYLGETENAIRDIFVEARKYQPSIIFMDEVDSLVPNRNSDDSGESESRVVATLLTMMDSIGDSSRIVIVGSTNRPNTIDPALRRPGRFDQEVEIGIPDVEARGDILQKLFGKMNVSKHNLSSEDITSIASKTHGYVGADLTALCRESVMKAIARGLKDHIDQEKIVLTLDDVLLALPDIRPSAMREIFLEMPKVYWSDIGGQEELKKKLIEVIQLPLEASEAFRNLGVLAPKGVLLYGPPGCSKTLTAKALATESGLNFLAVKGPEIFNKYVGESERTIREIFRKARAAAPSIIFFDEIDAISGDRDGGGTSASQHVLTSLLNEIDGVEELKGVVIVAATNRPTEIDAALLRPGRLDRHIYVAPPDYDARLQILTKGSSKFNFDKEEVDLSKLALLTEGCSGAEVVLLCQEAGLASIMENKSTTKVEKRHFDHALAGISRGITKEMIEYYQEFSSRSGLSI